jgi:hypothetical protein
MKFFTRTLMLVLLSEAMLLVSSVVVEAQFIFTTNNGSITITGYTGTNGSLVIPNTINGFPVTSIGDGSVQRIDFGLGTITSIAIPDSVTNIASCAFYDCTSLTNVTLGNGVISIGSLAFNFCTGLTCITLPNSATNIGSVPFFGCTSLTGLTIGSSSIGSGWFFGCPLTRVTILSTVTNIGSLAFEGFTSLTNIAVYQDNPKYSSAGGVLFDVNKTTLVEYPGGLDGNYVVPDSVTNIGSYAFYDCTNLTNVTLGSSVTSIEAWAFFGCTGLTNISFGSSVTSIASEAFYGCGSLPRLTIPASLTSIGDNAFFDCTGLTRLTIPAGVTNIGGSAFDGCTSLTNIMVDPSNPKFSSADGILFDVTQTTLIQFPGGLGGNYVIPNGVTSIGSLAFNFCTGLTSITIPDSVTSIGICAFADCTNLTNVSLGDGVTSIGSLAFNLCTGLASITIPNSATNIGSWAFASCAGLTSLTIPDSVMSIGTNAFIYCTGLTNVILGRAVTSIASEVFYGCGSLTRLTIPASVTSIGSEALYGCVGLRQIFFWGNAPSGDANVFAYVSALVYYLPGATGWSLTFGGLPALLWNPQVQSADGSFGVQSNGFGFNITGTSNISLVVEACTNVAKGFWVPLQTNSLVDGASYFSDPQWTNYPSRFYRLRTP